VAGVPGAVGTDGTRASADGGARASADGGARASAEGGAPPGADGATPAGTVGGTPPSADGAAPAGGGDGPAIAVAGAAQSGPLGNGQVDGAAVIPAVSASEARALIELIAARGIAQGELAGLLGLEKSTVSRLAAGLERKGWIRRGRDSGNQRYVRLYLTPEGTAVAGRVWHAWQSRQARIVAALSEEERAGLSSGLRGLVRGLAAEGLIGDPAEHGLD
jgi:DNA-binding MarR family transcriptional regulator